MLAPPRPLGLRWRVLGIGIALACTGAPSRPWTHSFPENPIPIRPRVTLFQEAHEKTSEAHEHCMGPAAARRATMALLPPDTPPERPSSAAGAQDVRLAR